MGEKGFYKANQEYTLLGACYSRIEYLIPDTEDHNVQDLLIARVDFTD
jgi:hypothetical protein